MVVVPALEPLHVPSPEMKYVALFVELIGPTKRMSSRPTVVLSQQEGSPELAAKAGAATATATTGADQATPRATARLEIRVPLDRAGGSFLAPIAAPRDQLMRSPTT